MTACVVGAMEGKPAAPDHKLMLVACQTQDEAHYLCALLNSSITPLAVLNCAVEIQMGPHVLEHIRVPRFVPEDTLRRLLANLSAEAHRAVQVNDASEIRHLEEVDRAASELWGLTHTELVEIQRLFGSWRACRTESRPQRRLRRMTPLRNLREI